MSFLREILDEFVIGWDGTRNGMTSGKRKTTGAGMPVR